jgi:sugar phosphate permease
MSVSGALSMLVLAWLLNGLFQAGLFPGCTWTIARWFPVDRRAFAAGMLAGFMSLGGALGSAAMGELLEGVGWRTAFAIFGSLGIMWALIFRGWFRDNPADHRGVNAAELTLIQSGTKSSTVATSGLVAPWASLLASPATWWICSQQFCRAAGQIFFGSWFATYLQEARGVSIKTSGWLNSLPQLSLILGAWVGGIASDWVLSRTGSLRLARQGVTATSMFLCAAFVFCAYFVQQPLLAVLIISAGTLFAAIGGPSAYAITIDLGGRHLAKLFGCMNMVGNLGAAAFIVGTPWFLRRTDNWDAVLLIFGGLYVAAGLFWLLLNPNVDIFQQSLWQSKQSAEDN